MFGLESKMTAELFWLILTIIATGMLWMPYITELIVTHGPITAMTGTSGISPETGTWADRAKKAHQNAIENLAIFVPLVLALHVLGINSPATSTAAMLYFFTRIAHYFIYVFAIPYLRTALFLAGFICQAVLAVHLLRVL